jgi:hypothetical protein
VIVVEASVTVVTAIPRHTHTGVGGTGRALGTVTCVSGRTNDQGVTSSSAPSTPASRLAGLLVAAQGVVVLAAAVFWLVEAFVADATSVLNVVMAVLLFALLGAGLLLVGRDLVRRRRWARAPAVTWQVICLPVAYGLLQSGRWYVGLPVAAVAVVVLVAVLNSSAAD